MFFAHYIIVLSAHYIIVLSARLYYCAFCSLYILLCSLLIILLCSLLIILLCSLLVILLCSLLTILLCSVLLATSIGIPSLRYYNIHPVIYFTFHRDSNYLQCRRGLPPFKNNNSSAVKFAKKGPPQSPHFECPAAAYGFRGRAVDALLRRLRSGCICYAYQHQL